MSGFFFPIFNYIANNRWAQIALTCGLVLIIGRTWLWGHDRRVKKEAKREVIEDINEQTDERVEAVEQGRVERARLTPDERLRQSAGSPYNRGRLRRS